MSNWKETKKALGQLQVGKTKKITFKGNDQIKKIKSLSSSCGCSKPYYDKDTNTLIVNFTPGPVPMHLRSQGYYQTSKNITVFYNDNTDEILSFSAKVYSKR